MSRSYKKNPVHPFACSKSERWDKIFWHSKFRSKSKQYIKNILSYEDDWDFPIHFRQRGISDTWCFNKDGKCWFHSMKGKRGKNMFKEEVPIVSSDGKVLFIYTIRELYQLLGK